MKTKILSFFLLTAILLTIGMFIALTNPDHTETFDNSLATATYNDGSFVGVDGITWSYKESRNEGDYGIDGIGLMLRDSTSQIYSNTITDGIGTFSVRLKKGFTAAGDRQVELFINGESKGTSEAFDDTGIHTFEIIDINIEGNVVIRIDNIKENQIVIDDISWTGYTEEEAEPEEEDFCNSGDGAIGHEYLEIKKVKISNRGLSDDSEDNVWYPLDTIRVEVELENNDESDEGEIEDMVFVLGLFEEGSTADIADEMFWISEDDEEIEIGDIEEQGEDDELTHTFEFRVNPEDLEEGKYVLKIKVYSDKEDEDNVCIDYAEDLADSDFGSSEYYAEIKIEKERENDERPVVVDIDELPDQIPASCGTEVRLLVDVWNIGDEDQEQVKVTLFNEALGIDLDYEIREDMDEAGDKEEIDFAFTVPKDAEEKIYALEFQTYYDYDEDDDLYDERSKIFRAYLKVEGNCEVETEDPKITAELDPETPEAIAGKQVIIRATIKNTV